MNVGQAITAALRDQKARDEERLIRERGVFAAAVCGRQVMQY